MDSTTRLDYALFQLTPTRTRCDLLVSAEGMTEKLASGLLQPFVMHLQSAKDQISKGGYSITLRVKDGGVDWFTKGTLERFVRFVSTPEVLERFVTIETEILQIESSVQLSTEGSVDVNAKKSIVLYKPTAEPDDTLPEDNSKQRLQKVLEARKRLLRKEQAMAYARAFVAGYEVGYINNLISFADAFGASRLKEACINFKELCNQKHNDGLWMDELAAVEALPQLELPYLGSSGIVLTTENSIPSQSIMQSFQENGKLQRTSSSDASDSTGQMPPANVNSQTPMSWPNQIPPHFMYNYQNPGSQQMPPYQGYPFPGMHYGPQYFQGNGQWPSNTEEYSNNSDHRRNHRSSSKKKERSSKTKGSDSEQDVHTGPDESVSGSDSDESNSLREQPRRRKNGNKSSRTVVIRNINYIASKRKDGKGGASDETSTDEDRLLDGESLKQNVEDAVSSLEKHHRSTPRRNHKVASKNPNGEAESNGAVDQDLEYDAVTNKLKSGKVDEPWGSFQNLLMRDDDTKNIDDHNEYLKIKGSESELTLAGNRSVDLEFEGGTRKRLVPLATDSFVVSERNGSNEGGTQMRNLESSENFRSNIKRMDYTDDGLLFSQRIEVPNTNDMGTLSNVSVLKTQKGDDWFMINQPEKTVVGGSIFDGDHTSAIQGDYVGSVKSKKDVVFDDSIMVQSLQSMNDHQNVDSQWRTDVSMVSGLALVSQHENGSSDPSGDKLKAATSYEPDDLYMMLDRELKPEPTTALWTSEMDYGNELSLKESVKKDTKTIGSVDDSLPADDMIVVKSNETKLTGKDTKSKTVCRSLGKSKSEILSRSKKPSIVSRTIVPKSKFEKEEENRKKMEEIMIQRQKRIAERSAAKGLTSKTSVTSAKDDKHAPRSTAQDAKRSSLPRPVISNSSIDRLAYGHTKQKESLSPPVKPVQPKKSSPKVNSLVSVKVPKEENKTSNSNLIKPANQLNGAHSLLSDVKGKVDMESELQTEVGDKKLDTLADKSSKEDTVVRGDSYLLLNHSAEFNCLKKVNENTGISIAFPVLQEENVVHLAIKVNGFNTETAVDSLSPMQDEGLTSNAVNIGYEIVENTDKSFPINNEIIEEVTTCRIETTPPSAIGIITDSTHSRKKWTSDYTSPSAKGLKKLLFGRKKLLLSA